MSRAEESLFECHISFNSEQTKSLVEAKNSKNYGTPCRVPDWFIFIFIRQSRTLHYSARNT